MDRDASSSSAGRCADACLMGPSTTGPRTNHHRAKNESPLDQSGGGALHARLIIKVLMGAHSIDDACMHYFRTLSLTGLLLSTRVLSFSSAARLGRVSRCCSFCTACLIRPSGSYTPLRPAERATTSSLSSSPTRSYRNWGKSSSTAWMTRWNSTAGCSWRMIASEAATCSAHCFHEGCME